MHVVVVVVVSISTNTEHPCQTKIIRGILFVRQTCQNRVTSCLKHHGANPLSSSFVPPQWSEISLSWSDHPSGFWVSQFSDIEHTHTQSLCREWVVRDVNTISSILGGTCTNNSVTRYFSVHHLDVHSRSFKLVAKTHPPVNWDARQSGWTDPWPSCKTRSALSAATTSFAPWRPPSPLSEERSEAQPRQCWKTGWTAGNRYWPIELRQLLRGSWCRIVGTKFAYSWDGKGCTHVDPCPVWPFDDTNHWWIKSRKASIIDS